MFFTENTFSVIKNVPNYSHRILKDADILTRGKKCLNSQHFYHKMTTIVDISVLFLLIWLQGKYTTFSVQYKQKYIYI